PAVAPRLLLAAPSSLLFSCRPHRRHFHSVPTRRSSDLGAPLRLRIERQLGYKHAKYLSAIEAVASLEGIGAGKGGYWEDRVAYEDRKSTRLNSSHVKISYAVFCLKKKTQSIINGRIAWT